MFAGHTRAKLSSAQADTLDLDFLFDSKGLTIAVPVPAIASTTRASRRGGGLVLFLNVQSYDEYELEVIAVSRNLGPRSESTDAEAHKGEGACAG
jgi:hypothetical protein